MFVLIFMWLTCVLFNLCIVFSLTFTFSIFVSITNKIFQRLSELNPDKAFLVVSSYPPEQTIKKAKEKERNQQGLSHPAHTYTNMHYSKLSHTSQKHNLLTTLTSLHALHTCERSLIF